MGAESKFDNNKDEDELRNKLQWNASVWEVRLQVPLKLDRIFASSLLMRFSSCSRDRPGMQLRWGRSEYQTSSQVSNKTIQPTHRRHLATPTATTATRSSVKSTRRGDSDFAKSNSPTRDLPTSLLIYSHHDGEVRESIVDLLFVFEIHWFWLFVAALGDKVDV